jgi:ATP-binding cassette subfamily B protein
MADPTTARSVLYRYLRPEGRRIAALSAFMLAAIATQLAAPPIIGRFIDLVVKGGRHTALAPLFGLAGLFLVAAVVTQLFQIGATYFSAQLAWDATNRMRRDLATHVLNLDMSYHTSTSPGDVIERVDGDVAALANFFSQFVLQIVGSGLLLVGILIVLTVVVDWRLGVTLGAAAMVAGLVMHAMRNVARDQWERVRDAFSAFSAFLEERLAGLEDVRANAGGRHVMRRFAELTGELAASNIAASRRGPWIFLAPIAIFALGATLALALGAKL